MKINNAFLKIILIFSIFYLIGCESKEIKDAKSFIALNDYQNAIEKLNTETKNNPESIAAYELLAECYLKTEGIDTTVLVIDPSKFSNIVLSDAASKKILSLLLETDYFKTLEKIDKLGGIEDINPKLSYSYGIIAYLKILRNHLWGMDKPKVNQDSLLNGNFRKNVFNKYLNESNILHNLAKDDNSYSANAYYLLLKSVFTDSTKFNIDEFINSFPNNTFARREKLLSSITHFTSKISETSLEKIEEYIIKESKDIKSDTLRNFFFSNLWTNFEDKIKNMKIDTLSYDISYSYNDTTKFLEVGKYIIENYSSRVNDKIILSLAEYYKGVGDKKKRLFYLKKGSENNPDIIYEIGSYYYDEKEWLEAKKYFEKIKDDPNHLTLVNLNLLVINMNLVKVISKDAIRDSYTIKIKGIVKNYSNKTVYRVKVVGNISDQYGNNEKISWDYIDKISPGKRSSFEISFFYSYPPTRIKYSAYVSDFE